MASPAFLSQCQLHIAPLMPYWWYRPTLNQTGELNDAYWCRQSQASSR